MRNRVAARAGELLDNEPAQRTVRSLLGNVVTSQPCPTCQGRGTLFQACVKLWMAMTTGGLFAAIAASMASSMAR